MLFRSREALDIAPEEVAQAIVQVLRDQFAINESGLVSETAYLFGFDRVTNNVFASVRRGVKYALSKGMIVLYDDRYRLP